MKKLLLLIAVVAMSLTAVNAQSVKNDLKGATKFEKGKNAIGLRFGSLSTEISYQKYLSGATRLEADLGFLYNDGFDLNITYQYVHELADRFNWYFGAGPNVGFVASDLLFGVVGQVGIEYNFDVPISLSIDWRPRFQLTPATGFYADGFALSVRYRF